MNNLTEQLEFKFDENGNLIFDETLTYKNKYLNLIHLLKEYADNLCLGTFEKCPNCGNNEITCYCNVHYESSDLYDYNRIGDFVCFNCGYTENRLIKNYNDI